jgi:hypothetical protein
MDVNNDNLHEEFLKDLQTYGPQLSLRQLKRIALAIGMSTGTKLNSKVQLIRAITRYLEKENGIQLS